MIAIIARALQQASTPTLKLGFLRERWASHTHRAALVWQRVTRGERWT